MASSASAQAPDSVIITAPVSAGMCKQNYFTADFNLNATFIVKMNAIIIAHPVGGNDTLEAVCPIDSVTAVNPFQIFIDTAINCSVSATGNPNEWTVISTGNASIHYRVFGDCSILNSSFFDDTSAGGNMDLVQVWINSANSDTISISNSGSTNTFLSIDFIYPKIKKWPLPSPLETANYKGTKDSVYLYFKYRNTGSDTAFIFIHFFDPNNCNTYSLVGDPGFATATDTSGNDTLPYTSFTAGLSTGGTGVVIPPGNYLVIRERVTVTGCLTCNAYAVLFNWRCNPVLANTCEACEENYETAFNIGLEGARKLKLSRISPAITTAANDLSCNGDTVHWTMKIGNPGQFALKTIRVILDYHEQGNNALTIIDKSSLSIVRSDTSILITDTNGIALGNITACTGCFTGWASVYPLCTAQAPGQFQTFTFIIHDLRPATAAHPADSVLLNFTTFRCGEEYDSLLLNHEKYWNDWSFGAIVKDECNHSLPASNIDVSYQTASQVYLGNATDGGISSESKKLEGIHQVLSFSPSIVDLSIPPGGGAGVRYGDSADFTVNMNGITIDPYEYVHFGCTTPTQAYLCQLNGFLRAKVFCQSGLLVKDSSMFINYDTLKMKPVLTVADTTVPFTCNDGFYYAYFNLGADTNAYKYLNQGHFNFTLGSCCPADSATSRYRVEFHWLADPAGNCYSNILGAAYDSAKLDTSALYWLPLSSVGDIVSVHCPGCRAPGIEADFYTVRRVSFGLTDTDNDRIADTSLTSVTSGYSKFDQLNLVTSMHGDKLTDKLIAHLQDGDNTTDSLNPIPGYTYAQMLAHNAKLNYLQLLRTFPLMDTVMDIRIHDFTLYIDARDTLSSGLCYDCALYGQPPFGFTTMAVFQVSDTGTINSLITKPANDKRLFTFHDSIMEFDSVPQPHVIYQGGNPSFQFHDYNIDQRYRLSVNYDVCGNFESIFGSPATKESFISNYMWMSGAALAYGSGGTMPNNEIELEDNGWTLDSSLVNMDTLMINQDFADSFQFICSARGGKHYFVANGQDARAKFGLNLNSCDKNLELHTTTSIGMATSSGADPTDYFPYEFRRPAMSPVAWDVKLPAYHSFQNPALIRTYSYYLNTATLGLDYESNTTSTALPSVNDTIHFSLGNLPGIICYNDTADNVISAGDQLFDLYIIFPISDTICGNGDSLQLKVTTAFTDSDSLLCQNSNNLQCGMDTVIANQFSYLTDAFVRPNLEMTFTPASNPVTQQQVCWTLDFTNIDTGYVTSAYNVYIVPTDTVFLSAWTVNGIPAAPGVPYIVTPQLKADSTLSDTICAIYAPCQHVASLYPYLYWGWNCDTVIPFPGPACGTWLDSMQMQLYDAGLLPGLLPVDSFTLCEPDTLTAVFYNLKSGSVYPYQVIIDSLPQGFNVISCIAVQDTNVYILTTADTIHWDLPPGIFIGDSIFIQLIFEPGCAYSSQNGMVPDIALYALTYCGDQVSVNASFNPIVQSISNPSACAYCGCMDSVNVYIADGDSSSMLAQPNGYVNDSLYIAGTFYVNTSFTLTNCKVYTAPGAQIIVILPGSFTTDNTTIAACDTMWQGIEIMPDTKITIKNHSFIYDADKGIYAHDNSGFTVTDSYILDCVKSVYTPFDTSGNFIGCKVTGSTFGLYVPAFKPDFPGQAPHGNIPEAGIELNDMSVAIVGDDTYGQNTFYNMNTGITGLRSNITVNNSEFLRILVDTFYTNAYSATALSARGDVSLPRAASLTIHPLASGLPTVHDSHRGVFTRYSNLRIEGVDLINLYTGIYSTLCKDHLTSSVTNCSILASHRGINWKFNAGAASMYVADNRITMTGDTTAIAISMQEGNTGAIANYHIFQNYIYLYDSKYGIRARTSFNPYITLNHIEQNTYGLYNETRGMSIESCDSATITCNSVICPDTLYTNSFGMFVSQSVNNYIGCNNLDTNAIGVFFGGQCGGTTFKGNSMRRNFWGLALNKVAKIGLQKQAGNLWYNYRDTVGAINFNVPGISLSRFDVHSTSIIYFPTLPSWDAGWFLPVTGSPFLCSTSQLCIPAVLGGDDGKYERSIAQGSDSTDVYIPESKNLAQQYLFGKLSVDSALLNSDTVFTNFYSANENGSIGKLYDAKSNYGYVSFYDATFLNLLAIADSLLTLYTDSLHELDSLAEINPGTNYSAQVDAVIHQIKILNITISNLRWQRNSFVSAKIDTARFINDNITPNEIPEQNERVINFIYGLYIRYGQDTVYFYYNQILAIAQQCPYSGGPAVYTARTFIELFNENIDYNDQSQCLLEDIYKKPSPTKNVNSFSEISIVPNPADDKVNIILTGTQNGICKIEISNALGKVILKDEINCKEKSHSINTHNFVSGVYFVKVQLENSTYKIAKLIIER